MSVLHLQTKCYFLRSITIICACSLLFLSIHTSAYAKGQVLVFTKVSAVAHETSLSSKEVNDTLKEIGKVIDIPDDCRSQSDVLTFIQNRVSRESGISAIQIIGGDDIIPMQIIPNPAKDFDGDVNLATDDPYADINKDKEPDYPIARLPLGGSSSIWKAEFGQAVQGICGVNASELNTNEKNRNNQWASIAKKLGVTQQTATPVSLPKTPARLSKDAYFTGILLHGSEDNSTQWWGEDPTFWTTLFGTKPSLVVGMDIQHASFRGVVFSGACYGGDIEPFSNANKRTPKNSLALKILNNGAECFIGSTRISYTGTGSEADTVIPSAVISALSNGSNSLQGFYQGKHDYYQLGKKQKSSINSKMRAQYNYYGLVPTEYWAVNPQKATKQTMTSATSLVFDVSDSMNEASANSSGQLSKIDSAKEQGKAFVSSFNSQANLLNVKPEIGVVSFSDDAQTEQKLSNNYSQISSTVDGLQTRNMTNIKDGLQAGLDQLQGKSGDKLMVLLSDGMDTCGNSDQDILAIANKAKQKGVRIDTIGFGASGDLDESLLQEIADTTGGAYNHEDPSSAVSASVGLFGSMMNAQLASTSQVLASNTGTVSQGQTVDAGSFEVSASGDLHSVLYWPGSTLDLKLTDPDGKVAKSGYPGYTVQNNTIPAQVVIKNAKQGKWNMSVYGAKTSMDNEPYYAVTAFDETPPPAPLEPTATVEPSSTVATPAAGAPSSGDSTMLLLLLVVVALAAVGGVWALSRRKQTEESITSGSANEGASFSDTDEKQE